MKNIDYKTTRRSGGILGAMSHKVRYAVLCLFFGSSFLGYSQIGPKISSKVDTTFIKIGEQIKFTVTVETDSTTQVIFPEGQTFSPLETVEAFATDTTRKKDRITLEKTYALTQFDSGSYKLPAQRIDINGKGFFTDSLRIDVATIPVDTLAQKMYDIKPMMEIEKKQFGFMENTPRYSFGVIGLGRTPLLVRVQKKTADRKREGCLAPPL